MLSKSWAPLAMVACLSASFGLAGCSGADDAADDGEVDAEEGALAGAQFDVASLTLRTPIPATVDACRATAKQEKTCADRDGDGLIDAWEASALRALDPILVFDEDEKMLQGDAAEVAHRFGAIGRVYRAGAKIGVNVALVFPRDYGKGKSLVDKIFADPFPTPNHDGDVEVVSFVLTPSADGRTATVQSIRTSGEERNRKTAQTFSGSDLKRVGHLKDQRGDTRLTLYVSQNIHGLFITEPECEKYSDCSPDHVSNPAAFYRVPRIMNAGEQGKGLRLADDLGSFGFSDEHVWTGRTHIAQGNGSVAFCGGLNQSNDDTSWGVQNDSEHRCPHEIGAWLMNPALAF